MSDDIDIEEHDLFDDPKFKTIFPDLTKVKTEAPDVEDEPRDHPLVFEDDIYDNDPSDLPSDDFSNTSDNIDKDHGENYTLSDSDSMQNMFTLGNKIILGSKPSLELGHSSEPNSNGRLDEEISSSIHENDTKILPDQVSPQDIRKANTDGGNVFSDKTVDNSFEENSGQEVMELDVCNDYGDNSELFSEVFLDQLKNEALNSLPVVVIEEMSNHLEKSLCYCADCLILFPTVNALDAHKMAAHSFLVAIEKNKALKSTAKKQVGANHRYCNHCDKTFDDDALIKHLYELLPNKKFGVTEVTNKVVSNTVTPEPRLKEYYKCPLCSYYYNTFRKYQLHMINDHNTTKFKSTKSIFEPHCSFCQAVFSRTLSYNVHVKYTHSQKFLCKPVRDVKFKCTVCQKFFLDKNSANHHRMKVHGHVKNKHILERCSDSALPDDPSILKSLLISEESRNKFIPIDSMFQCHKCHVHFTDPMAAVEHSQSCAKPLIFCKICVKCGRKIRLIDKDVHEHQHNTAENWTVYSTAMFKLETLVLHCQNCNICYDNQHMFIEHAANCYKKPATYCSVCKIHVLTSRVVAHRALHTVNDTFAIVKCVFGIPSVDPQSNVEMNSAPAITDQKNHPSCLEPVKSVTKPSSDTNRVSLYYCDACQCSFKKFFSAKQIHLTKKCKLIKKTVCRHCGLMVTLKSSHGDLHKKRGLTLNNFDFFKLTDLTPIKPPMPDYVKCRKCTIRFTGKLALNKHQCHKGFKICNVCNEKFSLDAHKLHVPFHGNALQRKRTSMSDLMKKYESFTNMDNIVYKCSTCDVLTDSYENAVEHSQKHYSNVHNYNVIIKNCDLCNLKFDSVSFKNHEKLHKSSDMTRESFQILSYEYLTLLNEGWLKLFLPLSKEQSAFILTRSIYRFTRRVKMEVIKKGNPNMTLYNCSHCEKYVDGSSVYSHVHEETCTESSKSYECSFCKLPFAKPIDKLRHEKVHRAGDAKTLPFRIVLFNDDMDKRYNALLKANCSYDNNKIFKCYKCKNCQVCLWGKNGPNKHSCFKSKFKKYCAKCKEYITNITVARHMALHRRFPLLCHKTINIVMFNPLDKNSKNTLCNKKDTVDTKNMDSTEIKDKIAKLYKCNCGLHFTSIQTIERHVKICKPTLSISKEKCSKCRRLFPTELLVSHLCNHHSTKCLIVVEKYNSKTSSLADVLYQCWKCKICFMMKRTIRYHLKMNHKMYYGVMKCTKCNLRFTTATIRHHMLLHNNKRLFVKVVKDVTLVGNVKVVEVNHDKNSDTDNVFQNPNDKSEAVGYKSIKTRGTGKLRNKDSDSRSPDVENSCSQHETTANEFDDESMFNISDVTKRRLDLTKYSNKLYRCSVCSLLFLTLCTIENHMKRAVHSMPQVKCKICHLHFTMRTVQRHMYIHHELNNYSANDLEILDKWGNEIPEPNDELTDNAPPPAKKQKMYNLSNDTKANLRASTCTNKLYKCNLCRLHFIKSNSLQRHICTGNRLTSTVECDECHINFTARTLAKHKYLHHELYNYGPEDLQIIEGYDVHSEEETVVTENSQDDEVSAATNGLTDRGKLSLDVSTYSNNLYKCKYCPLHFLKKLSLTKHLYLKSHGVNARKCDICHLEFGVHTLARHKYLHHELLKYGPQDFVIRSHGLNKGRRIFKNTVKIKTAAKTKAAIERRNDLSISPSRRGPKWHYNLSNATKFSLKKEISSYSNKLYKCAVCKAHFLKLNTFIKHHSRSERHVRYLKECEQCHISFSLILLSKHMYIHHELLKYGPNDFEIVDNVDEFDQLSVKHKALTDGANSMDEKLIDSEDVQIGRLQTKFEGGQEPHRLSDDWKSTVDLSIYNEKLYKCFQCHLHFISKCLARKHISLRNHQAGVTCNICNLDFAADSLDRHLYVHHDLLKYNADDFQIVESVDESNEPSPNDKVDSNEVDTPLAEKSVEAYKNKDRESPTKEKKRGKYTLGVAAKSSIDMAGYTNKLYKCGKCPLHFIKETSLTKHKTLEKHAKGVVCDICNYIFTAHSLAKHKYIHHEVLNYGAGDMEVVSLKDCVFKDESFVSQSTSLEDASFSESIQDDEKSKIKLYRCRDCNVYFLYEKPYLTHMKNHSTLHSIEYIQCKICGLQFLIASLHKHIRLHHAEDFNIDDVLVKEYTLGSMKKSDVNLSTIDKVQSRLVSTTTDSNDVTVTGDNNNDNKNNDTSPDRVTLNVNDAYDGSIVSENCGNENVTCNDNTIVKELADTFNENAVAGDRNNDNDAASVVGSIIITLPN